MLGEDATHRVGQPVGNSAKRETRLDVYTTVFGGADFRHIAEVKRQVGDWNGFNGLLEARIEGQGFFRWLLLG